MKIKIYLLFVICFVMTLTVSAQDPEKFTNTAQVEIARKKDAALDAIANLSPSLKAIKDDPVRMIIEAAKLENPDLQSYLTYLKVLAQDGQARSIKGSVEFESHIALAKLGDSFALQEIFSEIDSRKYLVRRGAITKLAQIGSKDTYRKLYSLLDDSIIKDESISLDELIVVACTYKSSNLQSSAF